MRSPRLAPSRGALVFLSRALAVGAPGVNDTPPARRLRACRAHVPQNNMFGRRAPVPLFDALAAQHIVMPLIAIT